MVKAVDACSNESLNAAIYTYNIAFEQTGISMFKVASDSGGVFAYCYTENLDQVTGGGLEASITDSEQFYCGTSFYHAGDEAAPSEAYGFYGTKYSECVINTDPDLYSSTQRVETGEAAIIKYKPQAGDWVTPIIDVDGDEWRIEYRNRYTPLWPYNLESNIWPTDMEDDLWPAESEWQQYTMPPVFTYDQPARVGSAVDYDFRIIAAPSNTQFVVNLFDLIVQKKRLIEQHERFSVDAAGSVYLDHDADYTYYTRVQLYVRHEDGSDTGYYAKILDQNPQDDLFEIATYQLGGGEGLPGPKVAVYDSGDNRVSGKIDYNLRGY